MEWTTSETLTLAAHSCALCQGLGLRLDEKEPALESARSRGEQRPAAQPCNCVLKNIFRACYIRFKECAWKERHISRLSLEAIHGSNSKGAWSRKDEEYMADFCLVSKRNLSSEEYQIFKCHFILGADWRLCCKKLKSDRGTFFHSVYRIQRKLGRVFRELEPYSLYPLDGYFHGAMVSPGPTNKPILKLVPLRPPISRTVNTMWLDKRAA